MIDTLTFYSNLLTEIRDRFRLSQTKAGIIRKQLFRYAAENLLIEDYDAWMSFHSEGYGIVTVLLKSTNTWNGRSYVGSVGVASKRLIGIVNVCAQEPPAAPGQKSTASIT